MNSPQSQSGEQPSAPADAAQQQRVVVVTQDGMGVSSPSNQDRSGGGAESGAEGEANEGTSPADLVEQPAKVMRIGSMIKQLLEEVRNAPLDDAGRTRLAEIHRRSINELKQGLAPELVEELERLALPFKDEAPSDPELRIAHAQLVGWLEGLFHGIQTALFAQQMAAQAQLQEMRRALPPGHPAHQGNPGAPGPHLPGMPGARGPEDGGPTGQYL